MAIGTIIGRACPQADLNPQSESSDQLLANMNAESPTEIQLKAAVLNHLVDSDVLPRNAIVMNELPLGRTSVRADLVTLRPCNQICGIEIKSERDSLVRLDRQLAIYRQYFDRVILVIGRRHIKNVLKSNCRGIDLWIANDNETFEVLRSCSSANSALKSGIDLLTLQQAKNLGEDDRQAYCDALRNRFAQTSAAFWDATQHRKITPIDLRLLSRFEGMRTQITIARKQREALWNEWADFLTAQKSVHSSSVS